MNCSDLRTLSVSDDPADQDRLRRHAADCDSCAAYLEDSRILIQSAEEWRAAGPEPPAHLESRIMSSIRHAEATRVTAFPAAPAVSPVERPVIRRPRRWLLTAAAAIVTLTVSLVVWQQTQVPGGSLSQAVHQVRQAEQAYVRAIATLENQAAASLARTADPLLPGEQAVVLLNYQGRLEHLDSVIAEVRGFLDETPGHSGGHTVLLAAYKEKSEVLQEIIDLELGDI